MRLHDGRGRVNPAEKMKSAGARGFGYWGKRPRSLRGCTYLTQFCWRKLRARKIFFWLFEHSLKEHGAQVALASIREHSYDRLTLHFGVLRNSDSRSGRRTTRNSG